MAVRLGWRTSTSRRWRASRRRAFAVVLAVLASVLCAGGAANTARAEGGRFTYVCRTSSGASQEVKARIDATFPGTGTVGGSVQPRGVAVTVALPAEVLADATSGATQPAPTGAVSGTADLTTMVVRGGKLSLARWQGLRAAPTPSPADGDLKLHFSGDVPAVTADAEGMIDFYARDLALRLHTGNAERELDCAPDKGQQPMLGSVVVSAAGDGPGAPGRSAGPAAAGGSGVRPKADGDIPADCQDIVGTNGTLCAYGMLYSNVNKLHAAARAPATIVNLGLNTGYQCGTDHGLPVFCLPGFGYLNYQGNSEFAPARSTFLSFGFMPNTATMRIRQLSPMEIMTKLDFYDNSGSVTANAQMSIELSDVTVNGTKLDVGPNCRSAVPMDVTLGADQTQYGISNGGRLDGYGTIPPFKDCGAGEDLDPLLNGMISGKDNYIAFMQGSVCSIDDGYACPPGPPPDPR